jgi:RNA polymerase sigma factor (sigma-70 family)
VANSAENLNQPLMHVLVQGCLRNDRDCQRLLYQHYYSYAMGVCLRYCKSKDEAKEVLNDGFLKIFQKISQYRIETSFEGWLRRIMINASIDHYRKEVKHYNHYSAENVSISNGQASALDEMAYADLMHLVQQLTPAYRLVFSLYVMDGFTHEEIATMLNISEGTSKSNLSKARENLRTMLERLNNKQMMNYV